MHHEYTYHANYIRKIMYWTNQLVRELQNEGDDKSVKKMQKALNSLHYFAEKQIEIERMEEQCNEIADSANSKEYSEAISALRENYNNFKA